MSFYFKPTGGEIPQLNGCGLFFHFNERHYCFSNAHVLIDQEPRKSFILYPDGTVISIGGNSRFTQLPLSASRNDDKADIYVIELSIQTVFELKQRGQLFLNINSIITGHTLKESDRLFVIGFPANKVKAKTNEKVVIAEPLLFRTIPRLISDLKFRYSQDLHFLADYPRNTLVERNSGLNWKGPKPHGISGSGLWLIRDLGNFNYKLFLIGIFSEYDENRAILASTKIDLYIDMIRQFFDSTIPNHGARIQLS